MIWTCASAAWPIYTFTVIFLKHYLSRWPESNIWQFWRSAETGSRFCQLRSEIFDLWSLSTWATTYSKLFPTRSVTCPVSNIWLSSGIILSRYLYQSANWKLWLGNKFVYYFSSFLRKLIIFYENIVGGNIKANILLMLICVLVSTYREMDLNISRTRYPAAQIWSIFTSEPTSWNTCLNHWPISLVFPIFVHRLTHLKVFHPFLLFRCRESFSITIPRSTLFPSSLDVNKALQLIPYNDKDGFNNSNRFLNFWTQSGTKNCNIGRQGDVAKRLLKLQIIINWS